MGVQNQLKTFVLLATLTALMLWVGQLFGQTGFYFAIVFVLVLNFGSYFFSHKIVLRMYRAKEVSENDYPKLFRMIREVTGLAKIPMPKVYIIPSSSPNAFATGRNPKNAVVAVTDGIMELLSEKELKGVIAHEVSHIKNRDILVQTVAATIAGVISYMGVMARWGAIFGGFGGRDGDNNIGEILVIAILTPLIAVIIQLAISRSREFLADESAAKTIHDPYSLANALEKLDRGIRHNPMKFGNKTTSSLFISNPFRSQGIFALFSTHPPMKERIKRLKMMSP
ncbi:zinc metalloprotease HtpX [Candidatus Woesearchaeota archaeon]|nr:zinc metalloprotease HtpX [Candidatus Woesearchaeota archaeon]